MQISSMEKLEITRGAIPPSKEEKGISTLLVLGCAHWSLFNEYSMKMIKMLNFTVEKF